MFKRIAAACLCAALISSPAVAKGPAQDHHNTHAKAGHRSGHASAKHKTGHSKKHTRHAKKKAPRHGAQHAKAHR